jgi:DNA polymerase-4
VQIILTALSESVAARLRENGFKCTVVEITVRDKELYHFTRQKKISKATNITSEIATAAMELFLLHYKWEKPIRSLGVRASNLVADIIPVQLDLFSNEEQREKRERMDKAVDEIRRRFGYHSIQRSVMYQDKMLSHLNAKEDHTVHPHSFFR